MKLRLQLEICPSSNLPGAHPLPFLWPGSFLCNLTVTNSHSKCPYEGLGLHLSLPRGPSPPAAAQGCCFGFSAWASNSAPQVHLVALWLFTGKLFKLVPSRSVAPGQDTDYRALWSLEVGQRTSHPLTEHAVGLEDDQLPYIQEEAEPVHAGVGRNGR